jgi:tRNA 2-thiouridine synthesizing protein A
MTTKHWDAGDAGCGQFIVGVKQRLGEMQAGQLIEIRTRNAGAPVDLPAWCRMSGHELVAAHHPVYVIRKTHS